MPTPWANHVTHRPQEFCFAMDLAFYFCALIAGPSESQVGCRGHISTGDVQLTLDGGYTFHSTPLHPFEEVPDTSNKSALKLHPFALPHLVASRMLDPISATLIARAVYPGAFAYGTLLGDCPIAQRLDVPGLQLAFSTTYDFELV